MVSAENINNMDSEGRREGLWNLYYTKDRLLRSGHYDRDLRQGPFKYYNTMSDLTRLEYYSDDVLEGEEINFKWW